MKEKIAAGVLVQNPINSDLYLGFKRKKSEGSGSSLPCGKSEEGETSDQTARRECKEETGWNVFLHMLTPYIGNNDDGFQVWIYSADLDEEFGRVLPKSADEGEMVWATAEELIAGPYGEFNRQVFLHFGVKP
jgi:8-oxo-dGTP pyrophosphatase MutT (NUDIX family)